MVIRPLAVLAVLFLIFNGVVAFLGRRAPARLLVQQIDASAPQSDAFFVGNSLMASGFNANAFTRVANRRGRKVRPLNIACGATQPVEHLVLLRRAVGASKHPQSIVYGFFDFQLTDPPDAANLRGNRTLSYYVEPDVAARHYARNWFSQAVFVLTGKVPYIIEQGTIWAKVEKARRRVAAVGMPDDAVNELGRVADFAALEQVDGASFDNNCHRILDRQEPLSEPIRELLATAVAQSRRVIVLEMPMPPLHRATFYSRPAWRAYQTYIAKKVRESGAEYVKASDWVGNPSCFADALHLNAEGAQTFSARLAEEMSKTVPQSGRQRTGLLPLHVVAADKK